jgi:hypothetical protein
MKIDVTLPKVSSIEDFTVFCALTPTSALSSDCQPEVEWSLPSLKSMTQLKNVTAP